MKQLFSAETFVSQRLFPDEFRGKEHTVHIVTNESRWSVDLHFLCEDKAASVSLSWKMMNFFRNGPMEFIANEMRGTFLLNSDCHRFRQASAEWFKRQRRIEIEDLVGRSAWAYD